MNKVINGKRYDTDKAEEVGRWDNGLAWGDLDYYGETLYKKRTGEFFLHREGGARSVLAKADGTGLVGGEDVLPLPYGEAQNWAERRLDADEYADLFGEPEDEGTAALNFIVSSAAKAKLERESSKRGCTQSQVIEELLGAL